MILAPFTAASAVSSVLMFLGRHWRWFAGGAVVIAVIIGLQIYRGQRDEARRQFEVAQAQRNEALSRLQTSNASLNRLEADVNEQNAAIDNLAVEGQARIIAGQDALREEIRRGASAATVAKELKAKPTKAEDQSRTSPKVLANKDKL